MSNKSYNYNLLIYINILYYLGSINDFAAVSPNGESSGKFININPYAAIFIINPNATTAEWLNPLDSVLLSDVFFPKMLNRKPPMKKYENVF